MSTIQVMRKALEALENCTSEHGHRCSRCDSEVDPNGEAITALRAEIERLEAVAPACNPHPKAPHGFNRNASHSAGRSVCDCESWDPYEEGYQAGLLAGLAHDSAPIAPATIPAQVPDTGLPWLPALGELVCAAKDREAAWADQERAIDAAHCKLFRLLRAATPAPATIPALTDEDVRTEVVRQHDDEGHVHFLNLAGWAYSIAAQRAGVQIKDTLQELADDAKQIGLEY